MSQGSTRLVFSPADSVGTIVAERRVSIGSGGESWEAGVVDLALEHGEVVASADAAGAITLERLAFKLAPIQIPASVFNREASLSNVRAELAAPALVTAAWASDDEARLEATLDLTFSWALTVEGNTTPLGAPDLPPMTVAVDLAGDGSFVHADVRAGAGGELWSWAGLIRLRDLGLVLGAETPDAN